MQIQLNNLSKLKNFIKPADERSVFNNLAPLKADTVSFSGSAELISADMSHAPNEKICIQAAQNAEPARYYLQMVFDRYIKPISKENSGKQSNSTIKTSIRVKSPLSIREKVVSKYSKMMALNFDELLNITIGEILENFDVKLGLKTEDINSICANEWNKVVSDLKGVPRSSISVCVVRTIFDIMKKNNLINISSEKAAEQERILTDITQEIDSVIEDSEYDDIAINYPTNSIEGVKKYAKDIIGGRIVISRNEDVSKILAALKKVKITSIEHYIPDKDKIPEGTTIQDYAYASDSQLKSLAKEAKCEVVNIKSKSGYMGIHVNIDLSNPLYSGYNSKFNGYTGEIQILGRDVEQLKEVEDLCYKLKDKKNAIKKVYLDFRTHFYRYYNDKTKKNFNDYTYALYLAQRLNKNKTKSSEFPSIAKLGFEGKVDSNLDFNLLKKIKSVGDYKLGNLDADQKKQIKTDTPVLKSIKSSLKVNF